MPTPQGEAIRAYGHPYDAIATATSTGALFSTPTALSRIMITNTGTGGTVSVVCTTPSLVFMSFEVPANESVMVTLPGPWVGALFNISVDALMTATVTGLGWKQ